MVSKYEVHDWRAVLHRPVATLEEARDVYRLSENSLNAAIHRGEIPVLRFGRRMVVPVPAMALQLLGVQDVGGFLQEMGVKDLPGLMSFLTGCDREDREGS